MSLVLSAAAVLPAAALAQSSGNSQYEENVPTGGGNGSNQGENSGGGGGGSGSGGSTDSGGSIGSSGGSVSGSPGGEFIPGEGVSSPDFGGSGSGSGGSGAIGESGSGGFGGGGSSATSVPSGSAQTGIGSLASTPEGALAGALLAGAASDLTGDGNTTATPASSTDSGGGDLWIPITIGAVALLAVIGWLGFRRMRGGSEGPATA